MDYQKPYNAAGFLSPAEWPMGIELTNFGLLVQHINLRNHFPQKCKIDGYKF